MEQQFFTDFAQILGAELHNVGKAISNSLRGEALLSKIKPLDTRRSQEYRRWLNDIDKYTRIVSQTEEEKCQLALITTAGQIGQFVSGLLANNESVAWVDLKRALDNYFGVQADPTKFVRELANIKQGRSETVQDYMQRLVHLAIGSYGSLDTNNEVIKSQVIGFFIEGLYDRQVKIAVMREEPSDLKVAYEKALIEERWQTRIRGNDREEEPMEINYSGRQRNIEAIRKKRFPEPDRGQRNYRGFNRGPGFKARETERPWPGIKCYNCGRKGHIARNCTFPKSGNEQTPLARRPARGRGVNSQRS